MGDKIVFEEDPAASDLGSRMRPALARCRSSSAFI